MHMGNGAITPECVILTSAAAAGGLVAGAMAIRAARPTSERLCQAAALGVAVFVAQMTNVPVAPGTSAHFVGGVLLAWLLGPGLGAWTMAIVLAVQAIALGDGGILAWGANVLNMALLPAGLVAAAQRLNQLGGHSTRALLTVGTIAALAMPLAAALIVGETALFRPLAELTGWSEFAVRVIGIHLWIGLIEGCATTAVVILWQLARVAHRGLSVRPFVGCVAAFVAAAALLAGMSSTLPDGYQAAAQASGMGWLLAP